MSKRASPRNQIEISHYKVNMRIPTILSTPPSPSPPSSSAVHHRSNSQTLTHPLFPTDEMPNSDEPATARSIHIANPDQTHQIKTNNSICTTKYNIITFIPRNLYEQFRRVAYIYFFILACLTQIPQLDNGGASTAFVPLGIVLLFTAVKDGYEDFLRRKSDKDQNERPCLVLDPDSKTFEFKKWKDVRAGEVVKVGKDETIPCDLVVLSTSDFATGSAYVQTINLDGESNLKTRYALHQFADWDIQRWLDLNPAAFVKCEAPNRDIHRFQGSIMIDGTEVSLGMKNVILRGCEIKNTEWVFGVAVYVGMETKVLLNSSDAPFKRSKLERQMNREIIILAVTMCVMVSITALMTGLWLKQNEHLLDTLPFYRRKEYVDGKEKNYMYSGIGIEVVLAFVKAIFLFQNIIPIALYISLEGARLAQTVVMSKDRSMYYEPTDTWLQCKALNINEDLGQIGYVFSDKTGTLTENKMVFKHVSVGGINYKDEMAPIPGEVAPHPTIVNGLTLEPKVNVNTDPKLVHLLEVERHSQEASTAHNFFLALTLCNTIVPQIIETSDPTVEYIDYQGESPDEQALVYAAAAYGYVLVQRTSGHIEINIMGDSQKFEILGIHEFDSDRKRMSVITRFPDNSIKLFVKGADNAMFSVVDDTTNTNLIRSTETHLHDYSSKGLRTLVIGMRELSTAEFEKWIAEYEQANTSLTSRSDSIKAIAVEIEQKIQILGATGIEDKLQEGVPESIESLRKAGIVVWVLTGDKQETAISIGKSSKLITEEMKLIVINSDSEESTKEQLKDAKTICNQQHSILLALIIDGITLNHILDNTELEEELFEVAVACNAVLCCRVAPLQKAGIVSLAKKRTTELTLSIGDGANDVSMIQMADVGIGISGQEGRQAVMASDFAIGQFRFLVPLLLVHGHWNYHRVGYLILYNIYRNAVLVLVGYWYLYYSDFGLIVPINLLNSLLFAAIYTSLPNIFVGIHDQDLSRRTLIKYPEMYAVGRRGESYNLKLFCLVMMDSLWQTLVIMYVPYFAYSHSTLDFDSLGDIWIFAIVLLVNVHLAMDVYRWNVKLHAVIWGSTVAAFVCILLVEVSPSSTGYRAFVHLICDVYFWLLMLVLMAVALLPRFVCRVFFNYLCPDDVRIGSEMEKAKKMELGEEDGKSSVEDLDQTEIDGRPLL